MMSFNIQSISAKFNEFTDFLDSLGKFKFDIICLQELWKMCDPNLFNIDGYHSLIFKSRSNNKQGGGVGIFVNKQLKIKQLDEFSIFIDKVIESVLVEIELPNKKKIVVGSIYRPNSAYINLTASQQLDQFNEAINSILTNLSGKKICLFGDINLDLLKIEQHKPTADYVNLLFSLGCLQLMTIPTRCIRNASTLIDHIITNDILSAYTCGALTNRISDHFPIFCILNCNKPIMPHRYIRSRHINSESTNKFKATLKNVQWTDVLDSADPQSGLNAFLSTFLDLYNITFPEIITKFNKNVHKKEKWMTAGIMISRNRKMLLCTRSIKDPSQANVETFKTFRNIYNNIVRSAKKLYFEKELAKHQKDLKQTWKILKEATKSNKNKENTVEFLKINGIGTSDRQVISDCFNKHFSNMAEKIANNIPPTNKLPDSNCKKFNSSFKSALIPITNSELTDITKTLLSKNSTDMNGLSSLFVKNIISSIAIPIVHIFNLSLTTGHVPSQLKQAKIIPIFKSGDQENVDNYRPISLLCTFSKILEKIMSKRLTLYLEENDILSGFQFGFRKAHNTAHPMTHLLNKVTKALNNKEFAIAIFCDLQKAFDTCDHQILRKKT